MRANTITRSKPKAWHPVLALVLAVCALAIPGTASAVPIDSGPYSSVNAITDPPPSQPTVARPNEGIVTPGHLHYAGPTLVDAKQPVASSDGFDWLSAAIGAGAAVALVALSGAVLLTVRRRMAVSPSVAS